MRNSNSGFCIQQYILVLILIPWLSDYCYASYSNQSHNKVTHLPGFDGPLPFELETGLVMSLFFPSNYMVIKDDKTLINNNNIQVYWGG